MRCPHCGEPVHPKQERCFACGQNIRLVRRVRPERPINLPILLFPLAAVLVVVLGLLVSRLVSLNSSSRHHAPAKTRPTVRDSVRKTKPVRSETLKVKGSADRLSRALDKLQARYELIKHQVVGETPTPEQTQLMHQIDSELARLRRTVAGLSSSLTREQRDQLEAEIAAGQRHLGSLISQFARAPKNRSARTP